MGIGMTQKKRGRSLPRGASIADASQRNTDKIAWQTNGDGIGGSTALPGVSQRISRTDEITTKKMYIRRKTGNTENEDSLSRDDLV